MQRAYPNIRVLRDVQRREAVQSTELLRRAYLALARNETLPSRVGSNQSRYRGTRPGGADHWIIAGPTSSTTRTTQSTDLSEYHTASERKGAVYTYREGKGSFEQGFADGFV